MSTEAQAVKALPEKKNGRKSIPAVLLESALEKGSKQIHRLITQKYEVIA
jgi:hypothetical protein